MTLTADAPTELGDTGRDRLRVVLCGSFHRDLPALRRTHNELASTFNLVSPSSIDFVDSSADFVRLSHEARESVSEVEQRHLDALASADFVWLCAPEGYVGASAALELGHARALGIPVFTSDVVSDVTLREFIHRVASPSQVPSLMNASPGRGLAGLQKYYARVARRRGWDRESARDTLLLITEELGELAREVRRDSGLARTGGYAPSAMGQELADVQLYLVHLANVLGVDIAAAVTEKERINTARFNEPSNVA